jgi:hypothetical protein
MNDRTKVMIAIAGTALVVGGTTAIASGGKGDGSAGSATQRGPGALFTGSGSPGGFGFHHGGMPGDMRGMRGGMPGLHGDALGAAAAYLGLTRAQLMEQLAAGKSLAQVAGATSGKSVDGLKSAIKAAAKADVDADVKAGRVTDAERDAFLKELDARVDDLVTRTGLRGHGPGPGFGHHGGPFAGAEIASYLGLTGAQLAEQLRAGKSLAGIAAAQGKSVAGLKDAIAAAAKKQLDQDVAEGHLTASEAAQRLADLKARLDEIVQNKGFAHPMGKPHDARPAAFA